MALTPSIVAGPGPSSRVGYRIELLRPLDRDAKRNRLARWTSLLLTSTAVVLAPTLLVSYWGSLISPLMSEIGALVGFLVGGGLWLLLSKRLLLYIQEWQAYVTNNPFGGGKNIPYGPGLHPTHFWEQRNKAGNYSLERVTRNFSISVPTKTTKVTATGFFQYAVDLAGITDFIGSDETTIEDGLIAYIESFLTQSYAQKTAEEARTTIDETNRALANQFMGTVTPDGTSVTEFETAYGIITVSIIVGGLELPDAVQKTRDAIDEAETLHEVVARLHGLSKEQLTEKLLDGSIPQERYERMLTRALATTDNAKMNVTVLETDLAGLAAGLFEKFTGQKVPGGGGGKGGKKGKGGGS